MERDHTRSFGFGFGLLFGLLCLTAWPLAGLAQSGGPRGCLEPPCRGMGGAQGQGPMRGMGRMGTPADAADMQDFHFLIANRDAIRRSVTYRPDGVETLTESDDPAIAGKIREHVSAMSRRMKEGRPIHRRDPLFAEIFAHADAIDIVTEPTASGLRVTETSADPAVVRLVQRHADVVSLFIQNGMREMMTNHEPPK